VEPVVEKIKEITHKIGEMTGLAEKPDMSEQPLETRAKALEEKLTHEPQPSLMEKAKDVVTSTTELVMDKASAATEAIKSSFTGGQDTIEKRADKLESKLFEEPQPTYMEQARGVVSSTTEYVMDKASSATEAIKSTFTGQESIESKADKLESKLFEEPQPSVIDKAKESIASTTEYVKEKASTATETVKSTLSGQESIEKKADNLESQLLQGPQPTWSEKAMDTATATKDKVVEIAQNAGEYVMEKAETAKTAIVGPPSIDSRAAKLEEKLQPQSDSSTISEKAAQVKDQVVQTAQNAGEYIKETAESVKTAVAGPPSIDSRAAKLEEKLQPQPQSDSSTLSDKAAEVKEKVAETTQNAGEYIKDKTESAKKTVSEMAESTKAKVSEMAESVKETVSTTTQDASDQVKSYADAAKSNIGEATKSVGTTLEQTGQNLQVRGQEIKEPLTEQK
jgi:hypothetical protein